MCKIKIICSDCGNEFNIEYSIDVKILGTEKVRYDCECGCGEFILEKVK